LRRIASYVNARDIIALSPDQLRELRALGFSLGYLGLESGSAEVLRRIHKGAGPEEMIECVRKAREADIKTSVIGLIGVGGREWSAEHARETARVLNEMRASLLSFLTAIVLEGTPFHAQALRGDFHPLTDRESLVELRDILSRLRLSSCVLRVNHTSNLVNLEGRLPKDQAALINAVEAALPFARDAVSCVWSAAQGQFL
jgi:histone acetyltransferase (RNA polymerase elongator complex component)